MQENSEKQDYLNYITNVIVDLNSYKLDLERLDKVINEHIRMICYYSYMEFREERAEIVQDIKNKFEKFSLRLDILKSKLTQHQKKLITYFETYNDFKNDYEEIRKELLRRISGFEMSISNQIVKCYFYIQKALTI